LIDLGVTLAKSPEGKLTATPAAKLTPALREAIKEHRDALLDELELARQQAEWLRIEETL
jgi:hypothetical protein